jgi:Ca2+-binding EF-hand superfamily protein
MFERADKNHDGVISVREMMLALRHDDKLAAALHLPSHIHQEDGTRAAFERVFAVFDENKTREITFDEFLAHIMDWSDAPAPSTPHDLLDTTQPGTPLETFSLVLTRPTSPPDLSRSSTHTELSRPAMPLERARPSTPPESLRPATPVDATRPATPLKPTRRTPQLPAQPTTPLEQQHREPPVPSPERDEHSAHADRSLSTPLAPQRTVDINERTAQPSLAMQRARRPTTPLDPMRRTPQTNPVQPAFSLELSPPGSLLEKADTREQCIVAWASVVDLREIGALAGVDDWRRIRAMFQRADKNHDGVISVREMMLALRHDDKLAAALHLPSHIHQEDGTRAAFERVFADFDENKTREITFDEFLAHIMDWSDGERGAKAAPSSRVHNSSAHVETTFTATGAPVPFITSHSAVNSISGRPAALQPLVSPVARHQTAPPSVSPLAAPPALTPLPLHSAFNSLSGRPAALQPLVSPVARRQTAPPSVSPLAAPPALIPLPPTKDTIDPHEANERMRSSSRPDVVMDALRRRKNKLRDADVRATAEMRAADAQRQGAPQLHATPVRVALEHVLSNGAREKDVATRLLEALAAAPAALEEMEARVARAEADRNQAVLLRVQREAAQPRVHSTVLTDSSTTGEIARLGGRSPSARVAFCTARVQELHQQIAASAAVVASLRKLEEEALLADLLAGSPSASLFSAYCAASSTVLTPPRGSPQPGSAMSDQLLELPHEVFGAELSAELFRAQADLAQAVDNQLSRVVNDFSVSTKRGPAPVKPPRHSSPPRVDLA